MVLRSGLLDSQVVRQKHTHRFALCFARSSGFKRTFNTEDTGDHRVELLELRGCGHCARDEISSAARLCRSTSRQSSIYPVLPCSLGSKRTFNTEDTGGHRVELLELAAVGFAAERRDIVAGSIMPNCITPRICSVRARLLAELLSILGCGSGGAGNLDARPECLLLRRSFPGSARPRQ
jgi:hypothetical protein